LRAKTPFATAGCAFSSLCWWKAPPVYAIIRALELSKGAVYL